MSFLNPRDVHAPAGPHSHTAVVPQSVCVPQLASPAFLVEVEAIAVRLAR